MIRIARPAGVESLEPFVEAGVLGTTEIEVVTTIARVSGEAQPDVLLALALAVRGPLFGHVCIDLAKVADSVVVEEADHLSPGELRWPEAGRWVAAVQASTLVRGAEAVDGPAPPLVLDGTRLYLDRYWRYEQALVQAILARSAAPERDADDGREGQAQIALDRLFGPVDPANPDRQRSAAEAAMARRLTVIAGGPGTGKTRTVARLLAVLEELGLDAGQALDIRLAAPTGKAAARMTEAIVAQVAQADISAAVRDRLLGTEAVTLHRLLGSNGRGGFRHDAADPLSADVVVVDETSMVSLPLMARLFDAVRPESQIVLVGDPSQLASVEAGAVLGDLIGSGVGSSSPLGGHSGIGLVELDRAHRFEAGSPIAELSDLIRGGDAEGAIRLLGQADPQHVRWIDPDDADRSEHLAAEIVDHARRVIDHARAGRAAEALAQLADLAVLSATRLGPTGVINWNRLVEHRLARDPAYDVAATWYAGRPVIVTANDYLNQIANGDVGVTVVHDRPQVAFPAGEGMRLLDPSRLDRIETWWSMTIHKSQGSEFSHVIVALPPPPSPILTRELLYTAVTRASSRVTLLASEAAIRAAIDRPVSRASGLADRLRETLAHSVAPELELREPTPIETPLDETPVDDGPLTLF